MSRKNRRTRGKKKQVKKVHSIAAKNTYTQHGYTAAPKPQSSVRETINGPLGGTTAIIETTSHVVKTGQKFTNSKCRHFGYGVDVGGVVVYASSMHSAEHHFEGTPDFGLYADKGWEPGWRNEYVIWQDFGLPAYEDLAVKQIQSGLAMAKSGMFVEVGCIGGHGRTGTILAVMCVLNGMLPEVAIAYIRHTYCEHAIETEDQEWYVQKVYADLWGFEHPEKPKSWTDYGDQKWYDFDSGKSTSYQSLTYGDATPPPVPPKTWAERDRDNHIAIIQKAMSVEGAINALEQFEHDIEGE